MRLIKNILSLLLAIIGHGAAYAQPKEAYKITYSTTVYSNAADAANGTIKCTGPNVKVNDAVIHIYVENDVKNIPMELLYKSMPVYAKTLSARKPNGEIILFIAHANDIFRPDTANGYSWRWKARAKCPKSPTDDYNGRKVKKLTCWYELQTGTKENRQTYKSAIITIPVQ